MFETEVEMPDGECVTVEVHYDVSGGYAPATWGYYGGEPAEEPEVEIVSLIVVDDPSGQCAPGEVIDTNLLSVTRTEWYAMCMEHVRQRGV